MWRKVRLTQTVSIMGITPGAHDVWKSKTAQDVRQETTKGIKNKG